MNIRFSLKAYFFCLTLLTSISFVSCSSSSGDDSDDTINSSSAELPDNFLIDYPGVVLSESGVVFQDEVIATVTETGSETYTVSFSDNANLPAITGINFVDSVVDLNDEIFASTNTGYTVGLTFLTDDDRILLSISHQNTNTPLFQGFNETE